MVPTGVPLWLYPIMLPVEILGLFTKPFALTVRLFANMVAGHIVIFFLIALTVLISVYVVPVSIAFALGIFMLWPNFKVSKEPSLAAHAKNHWVLNGASNLVVGGKATGASMGIGLTLVGHSPAE